MEEILASIRRIISEQDATTKTLDAKEKELDAAESIAESEVTEDTAPEIEAGDETVATEDDGDVLELSVDAIVEVDEASQSFSETLQATVSEEQDEVASALDNLVNDVTPSVPDVEVNFDEPEPEIPADISFDDMVIAVEEAKTEPTEVSQPEPELTAMDTASIPAEPDPAFEEEAIDTVMPNEEDAMPAPEEITQPEETTQNDTLVSEATAAAIAAAFSSLSSALSQQTVARSMTIEELVREMIRPMLKEWLDANLPLMVEKAVKTEIERIVRHAFKQP
jgi:cell pole-organizing protein PopZ